MGRRLATPSASLYLSATVVSDLAGRHVVGQLRECGRPFTADDIDLEWIGRSCHLISTCEFSNRRLYRGPVGRRSRLSPLGATEIAVAHDQKRSRTRADPFCGSPGSGGGCSRLAQERQGAGASPPGIIVLPLSQAVRLARRRGCLPRHGVRHLERHREMCASGRVSSSREHDVTQVGQR